MPRCIRITTLIIALSFLFTASCRTNTAPPDTALNIDHVAEPVAAVGPPDCPGGITDDGDCCGTGIACGNSCISAEHECHLDDNEPITVVRPTSTQSFDNAKDEGWQIFADYAVSFYCYCPYTAPIRTGREFPTSRLAPTSLRRGTSHEPNASNGSMSSQLTASATTGSAGRERTASRTTALH